MIILPLDSDIIKVGRDALELGTKISETSKKSSALSFLKRNTSTTSSGVAYIDQEYNTTVFLLKNIYYKTVISKIFRQTTTIQYFESSPLLGRWYSTLENFFLRPSTAIVAGKLPDGVGLISTGSNSNRSLKVYGKILGNPADIFPKPVKYDSYPIYNKGYVVRYHFIPPEPLTRKIYAIDISLDWSDLRDSFIRQVEDQKFQDDTSKIIDGGSYVSYQKSLGFYGD
jgi:hypothetical protein